MGIIDLSRHAVYGYDQRLEVSSSLDCRHRYEMKTRKHVVLAKLYVRRNK